jgi:hypothetical protein
MDRNLYERANDVRWWALTSRFREILGQPSCSEAQRQTLTDILAYINSLYTVYTNLILFDAHRVVVAVSNPQANDLVGTVLPAEGGFAEALSIQDSRRYTVTPFQPTHLYNNQPTYTYVTSVRSLSDGRAVGGIAIVFDSEPQFSAMLEDALPRDEAGHGISGSFAAFADRQGRVISATGGKLRPGDQIQLEGDFLSMKNGMRTSALIQYEGAKYALGAAVSQGYREYKTTNDYDNDVVALVFMSV